MAHASERESPKMMAIWKEEKKATRHVVGSSSYCLFPESAHTHHNIGPLHDIFSMDQPQPQVMLPKQQDNPRSEVLTMDLPKIPTKAQTQFPFQAMKQRTCLTEGEDTNANGTASLNTQIHMSKHENNVPVSTCATSSCQSSYIPFHATRSVEATQEVFDDIMAVQQAYLYALHNPENATPIKLLHQSRHALKHNYFHDNLMMSQSEGNSANAVSHWESQRILGSSQIQYSELDNISHLLSPQQSKRSAVGNPFRIIDVEGNIFSLCTNPKGSRLIQLALETSTPEEITMVYEELIPYARLLTKDVFANYAIQKLLEHGPQLWKRKFISNLVGHVLPLSLHMHGSRVIQKGFEVADDDLKVQMVNEFRGKVLKCARDQYANHVIQKCMEFVPPQHIEFIFRSFCKKAKTFSTTAYGCHVLQKFLTFCNNPEIYYTIVSEILEDIVNLGSDPFGNYVVQHIVEHGGPVERSTIVKKFAGRVLRMSCEKFGSNVIEKCLTFGSFQDRQLITTEILTHGNGQQFEHLVIMMCHEYANYVIQKLVMTAEEGQLRVLVEVAHRNLRTIMKYMHGRHVLACIQGVLTSRGISSARVANFHI